MTTPETTTPAIERPDGAPAAPTPAKPAEPETGFHFYAGKHVAVQLVVGRDKEGREVGTKMLFGKLAVTRGIAQGSYLFLLEQEEQGGKAYISIYPEDVRHLTHAVENRIVAP